MTHLELPEEMDDRPVPFSSVNCGEDYDDEEDGLPKIRIGICAMSKKVCNIAKEIQLYIYL